MKNKRFILITLVLISAAALLLYIMQSDKKDTKVSTTDIPKVESTDTSKPQFSKESSTPLPVPTSQALANTKPNTFGTTAGNLMNWGNFTSQGNWMYSASNNALVRTMLDGETAYKLLMKHSPEGRPTYLNVVGDWLYYTNSLSSNAIFRAKIDGSNIEQISHESAIQMCVINDYIYLINPGGLKRIKTDGSELTTIYGLNGETAFFSFDETHLYLLVTYPNDNPAISHTRSGSSTGPSKLYRMNFDGTDVKLINEKDPFISFMPYENYIYYINIKDQSLYKMKNDGTKKMKLLNESAICFNISENSIFYTDSPESKKIYKVDLDGKKKSEITNNLETKELLFITNFSVIGDSIYFYTYSPKYDLTLVRIQKDGSFIKYIQ